MGLTVWVAHPSQALVCVACEHKPSVVTSQVTRRQERYVQGVSPTTLVYQSNWLLAQVVLPAYTLGREKNVAAAAIANRIEVAASWNMSATRRRYG